MDQLRVQRLKKRYPIEAAQLKGSDEAASTGMLLAVMDLDATFGFAATEFLETMAGEPASDTYFFLIGVLDQFTEKLDKMFPGLSDEEKIELKQKLRRKKP